MKKPSEGESASEALRREVAGLGERSIRKSYYPELQQRVEELERFRDLLDQSRDAVFTAELPEGRLVDFNRAAGSLFASPGGELAGMTLEEALPPSLAGPLRKLAGGSEPGGTITLEGEVAGKGDTSVHLEMTARSVAFQDRRYLVVIARDVTERVRLQKRLRHGQRLDALGLLAGQVAHEVRNRLVGILGFAELLVEDMEPGSEAHLNAEGLRESCTLLDGFVARLLAFSRRSTRQRIPLDLNRVVAEVGDLVALWSTCHLEVLQDLHPVSLMVEGDAQDLQSALLNLVTNARDAMPVEGTLTLGTARSSLAAPAGGPLPQGCYAEAFVRDTGIGIPEDMLARLPEPFLTTKNQGRGTGLGLSTVDRIMREHGGAMLVESTVGEGSTFRLLLPLRS